MKLPDLLTTENAVFSKQFKSNVYFFVLFLILLLTPTVKLWLMPMLIEAFQSPKTQLHLVHLKSYYEYPDKLLPSHPKIITEHLVHIFFSNKNLEPHAFPMTCMSQAGSVFTQGRQTLTKISSNMTTKTKSECGVYFYKLNCAFVHNKINETYIRINKGPVLFVNASYVDRKDRDLVYCMRPLHNGHHSWKQMLTFIEVARAVDVNLIHAYVNSISVDAYEQLKKYELEKWIRMDPGFSFKQLDDIPGRPFDTTNEFLYQTAATMDCYHEHRQYTDFITFLDWNDLILPRSRYSLPVEVAAIFGYNRYAVALKLKKHPAIMRNETKLNSLEIEMQPSKFGKRYIYITKPRKLVAFTARSAVYSVQYTNRADMRADGKKTLTEVHQLNTDYLLGLTIMGNDWSNYAALQHKLSKVANFNDFFPNNKSFFSNFDLNDFSQSSVNDNVNLESQACQIHANSRLQSLESRVCPQTCPTIVSNNTIVTNMKFKLGIKLDHHVFYHTPIIRNMKLIN